MRPRARCRDSTLTGRLDGVALAADGRATRRSWRARTACTRVEGSLPYRIKTRAVVEGAAIPTTTSSWRGVVDKEQIVDPELRRLCAARPHRRQRQAGVDRRAAVALRSQRAVARDQRTATGRRRVASTWWASIEGAGLTAAAPWTARLASLSAAPCSACRSPDAAKSRTATASSSCAACAWPTARRIVDVNGRVGADVAGRRVGCEPALAGDRAARHERHAGVERPRARHADETADRRRRLDSAQFAFEGNDGHERRRSTSMSMQATGGARSVAAASAGHRHAAC